MACFSPLDAWQTVSGDIQFYPKGSEGKRLTKGGYRPPSILRELSLPCGQCIGCRLERSRQWAIRCMHEAQMHEVNSFVTLTYDDDHLPVDGSLRYRDFQLFMKRLRKQFGNERQRKTLDSIRFYMCGEYGDNFGRPHFHACLFGVRFADCVAIRDSSSGSRLYRSATLEKLWPHGFSSIGDVTFESAAYVARYVMKKVTGSAADEHYKFFSADGEVLWREPEFTRMSLKPGIGATWFEKFKSEVFPDDFVVVRGKKMKPPKYYDKLLALDNTFLPDDLEYARYKRAIEQSAENSRARLVVREKVTRSRCSMTMKRSL